MSRTVIREALRSLAALRLIDLGIGKRPAIAQLDDSSIAVMIPAWRYDRPDRRFTMCDARTAALAALRRTEAEAEAILGHAQAMVRASGDPKEIMEHDIALHIVIAHASRNRTLELLIVAFQGVTRKVWPIGWKSRANEHERAAMNMLPTELAQTIVDCDPQAFVALMNRHFD